MLVIDYSPCCKMVKLMMNNTFRPLPTDHPFIVAEFNFQKECICKAKGIEIHVAQFDQQSFDDDLFYITNVYCPIAISQSVDKRKAEYFAGRYLVSKELQNLGFSHQPLEQNVDRSPRLPSDVIGSISHSNDLATVAVLPSSNTNRENIGLDIQHLISSEVCDDIENMVATVQEVDLVVRYGLTRAEAVTLLFSAKEAIYKALARFVSRGLDFKSAISNKRGVTPISSATLFNFSSSLPVITTLAPSSTNCFAVSLPIPEFPPVNNMFDPLISIE